MEKIRWGICGAGYVSNMFVSDLKLLKDAEITAVWSHLSEDAETFGNKYDIPERYMDYTKFIEDKNIDVIYIGVPHNFHAEKSIIALNAGKAVVCEKPFTVNAKQADKVIMAAKENKRFLMEAVWIHFFPGMDKIKQLIGDGIIGEITQLQADFGFRAPYDPEKRLFAPAMGGGALLDVGVYQLSLAYKLLGKPVDIKAVASLCPSGVDGQNAVIYTTNRNQIAILSSAIVTDTPQEALISGTKGSIRIHSPWWKPTKFTLKIDNKEEIMEVPVDGIGYHFEAAAVMNHLRKGDIESNVIGLDYTLEIMKIMDGIREQIGVKYPDE